MVELHLSIIQVIKQIPLPNVVVKVNVCRLWILKAGLNNLMIKALEQMSVSKCYSATLIVLLLNRV